MTNIIIWCAIGILANICTAYNCDEKVFAISLLTHPIGWLCIAIFMYDYINIKD